MSAIGNKVFIQTQTFFWVGVISDFDDTSVTLKEACIVHDTGDLKKFLDTGICKKCCLLGEHTVTIERQAITVSFHFSPSAPKEGK